MGSGDKVGDEDKESGFRQEHESGVVHEGE
jgi:hypothetical protein